MTDNGESSSVLFHGITYLGATTVEDPRNEKSVLKEIENLSDEEGGFNVTVSIPSSADGILKLLESGSLTEVTSFYLFRILQFVSHDSEPGLIGFTENSDGGSNYRCHVLRCKIPDAAEKIMSTVSQAFRRVPTSSVTMENNTHSLEFNIQLEIHEEENGKFIPVNFDKESFKLRRGFEKRVQVAVNQTSGLVLPVERCFGLLLCPGRLARAADMTLLDMEISETKDVHSALGTWDCDHPALRLLNTESKGNCFFVSAAVDLVLCGIADPVRFLVETKVRVFPNDEKWLLRGLKAKHQVETFYMSVVETRQKTGTASYTVNSIESKTSRTRPPELSIRILEDEDEEPLSSGFGAVTLECSSERLAWWTKERLSDWTEKYQMPEGITDVIVKYGVPHALRGAVWPLLSKIKRDKMDELKEAFRVLNTRWSQHDQAIERDIGRTFPAHQYFQESGEAGQEALYRVCKAYSLYDSEVGYCQGQSFLVAALLTVQMPEEEAFALFTTIMHDYHFRSLYLHSFSELRLRFWILEQLVESELPSLYTHFKDLGVEAHMYSSQWFLTLFTAKFPLSLVYHVIDWFLLEGPNVIYRLSLAMLRTWRRDLLSYDFEGVLRFFRVHLPRQFLDEASVISLIYAAKQEKISEMKEQKLRTEWEKAQDARETPSQRLERENKILHTKVLRLDFESDLLVSNMIEKENVVQRQMDKQLEECKRLGRELDALRLQFQEVRRDRDINKNQVENFKEENEELKELWRKEVFRRDEDASELRNDILRKNALIADLTAFNERNSKQNGEMPQSRSYSDMSTAEGAVELELAQTKVRLVEIQCKNQDLEHTIQVLEKSLSDAKNTWINKLQTRALNSVSSKK